MKNDHWAAPGSGKTAPRPRKARRRSVAAILREAYRRHAADAVTRRAVKGCIR